MVRYKQSDSAVFAFTKEKISMDYQLGFEQGTRRIYNGQVELTIAQDPEAPDNIGGILLSDNKTIISQEDPRNWGIQFEDVPLSQYFQEHGVRIVGSEVLAKESCQVVESAHRNGKPIKFWITMNDGFRCLQIQHEAPWKGIEFTKAIPAIVTFQIQYQAYKTHGQKVWFPLKGMRTTRAKLDNEFLGQVIMEVKDVQLNVDVSDQFQVKVDSEFPVWIERLGKMVSFKEIGWKP